MVAHLHGIKTVICLFLPETVQVHFLQMATRRLMNGRKKSIIALMPSGRLQTRMTSREKFYGYILNLTAHTPFRKEIFLPREWKKHCLRSSRWVAETRIA